MLAFQVITIVVELAFVGGIGLVLAEAAAQPGPPPPRRLRERAGALMLRLAVIVFFVSGVTKLMHVQPAMTEMGLLQLTGWKLNLVAGIRADERRALALPPSPLGRAAVQLSPLRRCDRRAPDR